jgi:hypothetical protein
MKRVELEHISRIIKEGGDRVPDFGFNPNLDKVRKTGWPNLIESIMSDDFNKFDRVRNYIDANEYKKKARLVKESKNARKLAKQLKKQEQIIMESRMQSPEDSESEDEVKNPRAIKQQAIHRNLKEIQQDFQK